MLSDYEALIAEFENEITIEERHMINRGLYCDGYAWICTDLTTAERRCILAEEIGHHKTSSGNILDLTSISNSKQEAAARRWAYRKLLPKHIVIAVVKDSSSIAEAAENLGVSEDFLIDAMIYYNTGGKNDL